MVTVEKILDFLISSDICFDYLGSRKLVINGYSLPENIKDNSIIWVKDSKRLESLQLEKYKNTLIVTSILDEDRQADSNFLVSNNSKELFFSILTHFFAEERDKAYNGASSTIETCNIGKDVSIGHNCYIGPRVKIGENVVIKNNVVIEGTVDIGNNTTIYSGVVIGSDGYGYFQDSKGKNVKVPHLGGVIIGNNVEIGANTCIDKGTLGNTIIGNNVKIDNLCHIAHNVLIEDNVSVIALSMVAGSVVLKENSYIAPSASIMNQLTIGRNSIVGLGAVVVKSVEDDVVVAGVPAKVIRKKADE